jgi:predicted negative regulator of RcsB-dependent stress response
VDVYSTEQEQIALLKKWLKTYAPCVIAGVIVALAVNFGLQHWHTKKLQMTEAASVAYVNMVGATMDHLDSEASLIANSITQKYSNTPYAQFASLLLAKQAAENGAYDEASKRLTWVMDKTEVPAIKQVARIRLAKVEIAAQQPEAALTLLKTIDDPAYLGMIEEARGDAYLALKQTANAKAAYLSAEHKLPASNAALIQMKLANIA